MRIFKSPGFLRLFKKYAKLLKPAQLEEVFRRLRLFEKNWNDPALKTHKLTDMKGKWACTILEDQNRSDRLVFIFAIEASPQKEKVIWLLGIGSHDLVYRKLNL